MSNTEIQGVYIYRCGKNWYGLIKQDGQIIWRKSLRTPDRAAALAWKARTTAGQWMPKMSQIKETLLATAIKAERVHLGAVYCRLTRLTYENYLSNLEEYLEKADLKLVHEFGQERAHEFLDGLAARMEPKGVRDRYRYLRQVFRKWVGFNFLEKNPLENPEALKALPKILHKEKPFWTPDEMEEILEDRAPDTETRAFWACMYHTGLRFHEARGLTVENLDLETGEIKIRGKGGKVARVAMNNYLLPIMERIAQERQTGPCFPTLPGSEQGCLKQLQRALEGMKSKAGGNVNLHRFRHSCASNLLRAGENIVAVAKVMRHSSPRITIETYSHVIPSDTTRAVNRLVPANRLRLVKNA